jgi:hypothetical protein
MRLVASVAIATMLFATPASSAVMLATFSGTIEAGAQLDTVNLFGGGDHSGKTFVGTFQYDTSLAPIGGAFGNVQVGGGAFSTPPTPSPITEVTLTIDGITYSYSVAYSEIFHFPGGNVFEFSTLPNHVRYEGVRTRQDSQIPTLAVAFETADFMPPDLITPYSASGTGVFGFEYYSEDPVTGAFLEQFLLSGTPTSLTVTRLDVPEPATWIALLLGFFSLGSVLRRRRAQSAAT